MRTKLGVWAQYVILWTSYALHVFSSRRPRVAPRWVVGVEEVAAMLWRLQEAVPESTSVALTEHPFYSYPYTIRRRIFRNPRIDNIARLIYGAWVLGRLTRSHTGFIYVGHRGFLITPDARAFEFRFLRRRRKHIVCYCIGDDVRSQLLTAKLADKFGSPNLATIRAAEAPEMCGPLYEASKEQIARVIDRYADVIFNYEFDQASYIRRATYAPNFAYPDELFFAAFDKYQGRERPVIVHAPSNGLVKGTAYVRDAIRRLEADGLDFEYVELSGVSNDVVIESLSRAHIALNQFHAYTPGVFGMEALANSCVMLCSADERIETGLPEGANTAWVVTHRDEIYANVKRLIENPQLMEPQAKAGFEWARREWSASAARNYFGEILDSLSAS